MFNLLIRHWCFGRLTKRKNRSTDWLQEDFSRRHEAQKDAADSPHPLLDKLLLKVNEKEQPGFPLSPYPNRAVVQTEAGLLLFSSQRLDLSRGPQWPGEKSPPTTGATELKLL